MTSIRYELRAPIYHELFTTPKKKLINTGWVEEKYREREAELGSLRFGTIWYDLNHEIFKTKKN